MPCRLRLALALTVAAAGFAPVRAEVIKGAIDLSQADRDAMYGRFAGGWPDAPVANSSSSFVAAGLDLSGIGWRSVFGRDSNGNVIKDAQGNPVTVTPTTASVTLISQNFVLGANHYGVGDRVSFLGAGGQVVYRDVISTTTLTTTYVDSQNVTRTLPSDILIGRLSAPVTASTGVTPISIANPNTVAPGLNLLVYGQNSTYGSNNFYIGKNTLQTAATFESFSDRDTHGDPQNEYTHTAEWTAGTANGNGYLTGGDSGGPLLARRADDPTKVALLGGHYGVSSTATPLNGYPGTVPPGGTDPTGTADDVSASSFVSDPQYISQINALLAGVGEPNLVLVPVPEPAGLVLVAAVGAVVWRRVRGRMQNAKVRPKSC